jgi:hypothetical protein
MDKLTHDRDQAVLSYLENPILTPFKAIGAQQNKSKQKMKTGCQLTLTARF